MSKQPDDKTLDPFAPQRGDRIGHYEILEELGAGGMGQVYKARDHSLNRDVALKFLLARRATDTDAKLRFEREAKAAAGVNHPNIVHVYEVGEYRGYRYLAMEYVNGKQLSEVIEEDSLSPEEVLKLMRQVASGLADAHAVGVVHRDIKPSNILLDHHGAPRLLDFGLALCVEDRDDLASGSPLGTVGYMSPEQVHGQGADHRSDLFSLGVVFYELITGRKPFNKEHSTETLKAIVEESPRPLSELREGVSPGVERMVEKLLEKDPAARYQSARELVSDLRRELRSMDESTGAVWRKPVKTSTWSLSWKRAGMLLGSVLLATVGIVGFQAWDAGTMAQASNRNRVAVIEFENLSNPDDPGRLGDIAADLLIAGLSESRSLHVVSRQRVRDVQRQLGVAGRQDEGFRAVADAIDAGLLMTGSILQTEPYLVLTAVLIDVDTGEIRSSERVQGNPGDSIFKLVDALTEEFWAELVPPGGGEPILDLELAQATTHSPQAYRLYLEGMDNLETAQPDQAVATLKQAVAVDPEFTMAYVSLARICSNLGHAEEARKCSEEALARIESANWRQKLLIRSVEAQLNGKIPKAREYLERVLKRDPQDKNVLFQLANLYQEEDDAAAVNLYQRVVSLDPAYKEAYSQMAASYSRLGNAKKALWAAQEFERLSPEEPTAPSRGG